ncbi:2-amino-4-hydroxy-6-hydroxymethyldihydropteridine diphosphokinase [Aquimonas voraii]|uniref:2-amino-4-hydroxy-6- hydroxymethyldihydropteridine diphosphokinase n=1 Tax=Aquimonas voraii TaxID=265719 RepID=UPI000B86D1D5|nr:2-amino-4-hydroxy-6-hydroxymethyldihydropteridine diphosphokinase [Aquimonas voraii]
MSTDRAFVGLGSNLDLPERQIGIALRALSGLPGTRVLRSSSLYRTPPWGDTDQPEFINAVAWLETRLEPSALLEALLGIELLMGRVRTRRYGPRVIDLDLLMWGDKVVDSPRLVLPHPRMHERAFVMWPLAEIAPDLVLGAWGRAAEIAEALPGEGIVRLPADG